MPDHRRGPPPLPVAEGELVHSKFPCGVLLPEAALVPGVQKVLAQGRGRVRQADHRQAGDVPGRSPGSKRPVAKWQRGPDGSFLTCSPAREGSRDAADGAIRQRLSCVRLEPPERRWINAQKSRRSVAGEPQPGAPALDAFCDLGAASQEWAVPEESMNGGDEPDLGLCMAMFPGRHYLAGHADLGCGLLHLQPQFETSSQNVLAECPRDLWARLREGFRG